MDKSVTVSVKGIVLAGVALLALLTAYLLGAAGGPPTSPANADDGDGDGAARQVTMVGVGTATAVPDQVAFTVTVTALETDLEDALATTSGSMEQVLARLGNFGVGDKDKQTTGLSMHPEYDYPNYGSPVLKGYRVTQKARVTVPELAKAGRAITAAVDAGGNHVRVGNIRLQVSDIDQVLAQARAAAVEQARTKAEEYAEASGVDLGEVHNIREVSVQQAPQPTLELSYRAADKAMPIEAGESDSKVRVQVVWDLS